MHSSSWDSSSRRLTDVIYGLIITILAAAMVWATKEIVSIKPLRDDVQAIKSWKDVAIQQMGNIDGKLDALLRAQDIKYTPREK